MASAHVITVSERVSRGEREDHSGQAAVDLLTTAGHAVTSSVAPDGAHEVRQALTGAVVGGARIIITSGGTGVSPRDRTPEGTLQAIDREIPGVAELLRAKGAEHTSMAVLSRGLVGVVDADPAVSPEGAVIANLPGNPKGVAEGLPVLIPLLPHLLDQLAGGDH